MGNDGRNKRGTGRETITITPTELLEKFELFELNEKLTINYYKKHRIQMAGVMTDKYITVDDVLRHDIFGNLYKKEPSTSTIVFGDMKELGWEIWLHFQGIVVNDLHIGDTITIQGNLRKARMHKDFSVGMDEDYYRDVIIIDIKDCVIIDFEKLEL
jgi:hypothetical protein